MVKVYYTNYDDSKDFSCRTTIDEYPQDCTWELHQNDGLGGLSIRNKNNEVVATYSSFTKVKKEEE